MTSTGEQNTSEDPYGEKASGTGVLDRLVLQVSGYGVPLGTMHNGAVSSHVKTDTQMIGVGEGDVGRLKLFKNFVVILTLALYLSRGNAAEKNSLIVIHPGSCLGHACGR